VGATGGTASCGVVRSDDIGRCGLMADFAMRLSMNVWHVIFDEDNVKGYAPALEDEINIFFIVDVSRSTYRA
jgi:hypothetical protein